MCCLFWSRKSVFKDLLEKAYFKRTHHSCDPQELKSKQNGHSLPANEVISLAVEHEERFFEGMRYRIVSQHSALTYQHGGSI